MFAVQPTRYSVKVLFGARLVLDHYGDCLVITVRVLFITCQESRLTKAMFRYVKFTIKYRPFPPEVYEVLAFASTTSNLAKPSSINCPFTFVIHLPHSGVQALKSPAMIIPQRPLHPKPDRSAFALTRQV